MIPIQSLSRNVCLSVCSSVCLSAPSDAVFFKGLLPLARMVALVPTLPKKLSVGNSRNDIWTTPKTLKKKNTFTASQKKKKKNNPLNKKNKNSPPAPFCLNFCF